MRILAVLICCLALTQAAAAQSGPFSLTCRIIGSSNGVRPATDVMRFAVDLNQQTWCENCTSAPSRYQSRAQMSATCEGCPENPTINLAREDDRGAANATINLPTGRGQYSRVTAGALTSQQIDLAECRPR